MTRRRRILRPWLALLALGGALPAALAFRSPGWGLLALGLDGFAALLFSLDGLTARKLTVQLSRTGPTWTSSGVVTLLGLRAINGSPRQVQLALTDRLDRHLDPRDLKVSQRLAPHGTAMVPRPVIPLRRGSHPLPAPEGRLGRPLLASSLSFEGEAAENLHVLPDLRPLARYDALLRQRRLREIGVQRARQRGEGTELAGLRAYVPGDSFGDMDWKATARRGRPVVREHEAERQQPLLLLLDAGRRMARQIDGESSRLDEAIDAALLLAHVALESDDRVGLYAFADRPLRRIAVDRGPAQLQRIARALHDLEPVLREPSYDSVAAEVRRQQPRRCLVVFFTDVLEPASLAQLAGPLRFLGTRHLCVCTLFRDLAIEEALSTPPRSAESLYRAGAAASLSRERSVGLARLRRTGTFVLEAAPGQLSTSVVNQYLAIKAKHLI